MNKIYIIGLFLLFLVTGCATNPSPMSTSKLYGGIVPSGGGQIFPPHTDLAMGTHKFTGSGPATAVNQPCTYGQSNCNMELTNNTYVVVSLPAGKPVGTQEIVTDWNGTAGTCVGGGSNISLAAFNGSSWICFGGSGGSVSNVNVNVASFCSGSGTSAGTFACYEPLTGSAQKTGLCVLNAYRNATATPQTCSWPTPFTVAAVIGPTNSVPPSSTTLATFSFPINMGTATETAIAPVTGQ